MRKQRRIWKGSSSQKRELHGISFILIHFVTPFLFYHVYMIIPVTHSDHKGLFVSYIQSSGYKPAPLDLNHVKLTPNQNTLVERLAENGHNVWARDRVRQGWTYSIVQVPPSLLWRGPCNIGNIKNVFIIILFFFCIGYIEQAQPPSGSLQPTGRKDEKDQQRDSLCSCSHSHWIWVQHRTAWPGEQ